MLAKLGPHIQNPTQAAMDWARQAPIVKTVDILEPLIAARPDAITIFRRCFKAIDGSCKGQDMTRAGQAVARDVLDALDGFRPTYVELYNETAEALGAGLEAHMLLTRAAVPLLHSAGLQVAGYSFTARLPDEAGWRYLQSQGWGGADVISIHEYWGWEGLTEADALRHRVVHRWLGGDHPPFIVTECGRGDPGWKGALSPTDYADELMAYDRALLDDPYVLGGTVFTVGAPANWAGHEVDEIVGLLGVTGGQEQQGGVSPWVWAAGAVAAGFVGYAAFAGEEE